MEAKRLLLKNDNNRLHCLAFTQLHFAPPVAIRESDLSQVYVVNVDNGEVFLKMVDLVRVPFEHISSVHTIPAAGKQSDEWKKDWLKLYPSTNANTMMAVYMYQRLTDKF